MTDTPAGPTPEHPIPAARIGTEDVSVVTLLLDMQQQIARVEGAQIVLVKQMENADASRREIHKKIDVVSANATAAVHRAEVAVSRAESAVSTAAALKPGVDDYIAMRGYAVTGLWALGLFVLPVLGMLGYAAVQVWHYVAAHIDWPRLWK